MHLLGVLAAVLLTFQEESVSSGNIIVRLPAGWKTESKPEGLFLSPGDLKEGESYVVILSPGGKAEGNLAEGLEKSWKEFESGGKAANRAPGREIKTEGGVDGLFSVGIIEAKEEARLIVGIALFKPADRYEAVIALSARDPVFARYGGDLNALLKSLRFKNVELPVATPDYELLVSASDVYTLFKDGSALASLPGEGLDGFDVAGSRRRKEGVWGRHERKGAELRIQAGGKDHVLQSQADGSWKRADGEVFVKAEPWTGLKADGLYLIQGREDRPQTSSVTFKPDGSFEDRTTSPPLSGTYEIASNTMKLKAAGHQPRSVSFVALDGGKRLRIGGTWFTRLP